MLACCDSVANSGLPHARNRHNISCHRFRHFFFPETFIDKQIINFPGFRHRRSGFIGRKDFYRLAFLQPPAENLPDTIFPEIIIRRQRRD